MNPINSTSPLSRPANRVIARLWLPLAFSTVCMALEGPVASSIIARHSNVVSNLASFQFGFGLILLFEGPIIALLSASAALVVDSASYEAVKIFSLRLSAFLSLTVGLLFLSGIFSDYVAPILQLSDELERGISMVCLMMFLAPFAVGMRRFYQGCLIGIGKTKLVALSTVVRLTTVCTVGFGLPLFLIRSWTGAEYAALAVISGMFAECLTVRYFVRKHTHLVHSRPKGEHISIRKVTNFYYPLGLNGLLNLSQTFLMGVFLSQGLRPEESLALWQILAGINVVIFSFPYSYQETILAGIRLGITAKQLRTFGAAATLTLITVYAVGIFSPLYRIWLTTVVGISAELQLLAFPAFYLSLISIGLVFLTNSERALLISAKRTKQVGISSLVELAIMFSAMYVLSQYFHLLGIHSAALAGILARCFSVIILKYKN